LPEERYGDLGRGLNHTIFQLRGGHLTPEHRRPNEMFVANAQLSGDDMMCRWDVAKEPTIGEGLS